MGPSFYALADLGDNQPAYVTTTVLRLSRQVYSSREFGVAKT